MDEMGLGWTLDLSDVGTFLLASIWWTELSELSLWIVVRVGWWRLCVELTCSSALWEAPGLCGRC